MKPANTGNENRYEIQKLRFEPYSILFSTQGFYPSESGWTLF